jgi:hypothetical protein
MAEISKLLAGLIQSEMRLKSDQVILYNQKFDIPPKQGVNVSVALVSSKVFGTSSRHEEDPVFGLVNSQSINTQETLTITIYSRDSSARERRYDLLFALTGDAAQQVQEKNSFRIGYVPSDFLDISVAEGSSRLNRYALTIKVLFAYQKTQATEYFLNPDGPNLITQP